MQHTVYHIHFLGAELLYESLCPYVCMSVCLSVCESHFFWKTFNSTIYTLNIQYQGPCRVVFRKPAPLTLRIICTSTPDPGIMKHTPRFVRLISAIWTLGCSYCLPFSFLPFPFPPLLLPLLPSSSSSQSSHIINILKL